MKLTLTSSNEQPVIRVDSRVVHEYGTITYSVIDFTAEDLRQLNEFATTCPTFKGKSSYTMTCPECGSTVAVINGKIGVHPGTGAMMECGFGK